jgi:hypothetical protein
MFNLSQLQDHAYKYIIETHPKLLSSIEESLVTSSKSACLKMYITKEHLKSLGYDSKYFTFLRNYFAERNIEVEDRSNDILFIVKSKV